MSNVTNDNGQATAPRAEVQLQPTSANRVYGAAGGSRVDAAPDPFDPASLRLSQDFSATVGVKKVLTTVPVRKPNRHEFVRVRSGDDWRIETAVFEDKVNRETYLIERPLWAELAGDISRVCLFVAISRQGDVLVWPVKLPGPDGRPNAWNDSALAAARLAETRWIRVSANMGAGMYDVFEAAGKLDDPEWPELPFKEILRLAFNDRLIRSADHPVLRALRGEV